jgi:hypothetical protein
MRSPEHNSLRGNRLAKNAPAAYEGTHVAARGQHQPFLRRTHPAHRHPVGSLFSQISGKFSKSLVFGTFFPVVFFVLLDWMLFEPYVPAATSVVKTLKALDDGWQTLAMGGLTVLFSGLLYILNSSIIRFYEGYGWADSWIGQYLVAYHSARRRRTLAWWQGLRALSDGLKGDPDRRAARDLEVLRNALGRRYNADYSSNEGSVLPTKLGNVIRSFEDYPQRQYGMSAIPLWPRLIAVVDPAYATSTDDAKSSFDFMINASFLSALSAGTLLLLGLVSPLRWTEAGLGWKWWVPVVVLAGMSWVFYRVSISRAEEWGSYVRGAFDLYRGKLLEQLGYDRQPADFHEEREFWKLISQMMVYGDPPAHKPVSLPRFGTGGTFAQGDPGGVVLEITRSASAIEGGWQTVIAVRNPGEMAVDRVRVTDTLPQGERYLWSSALSGGQSLPVTGSNPIVITLGALAPGETRIVSYRTAK